MKRLNSRHTYRPKYGILRHGEADIAISMENGTVYYAHAVDRSYIEGKLSAQAYTPVVDLEGLVNLRNSCVAWRDAQTVENLKSSADIWASQEITYQENKRK